MVWYSHLLKNFPQFIVIHTVKGFGRVNKAEIDVFLELSFFFHYPVGVGTLISGSSAFSKTSLNIREFTVHVFLKPCLTVLFHMTLSWVGSPVVAPGTDLHIGFSRGRSGGLGFPSLSEFSTVDKNYNEVSNYAGQNSYHKKKSTSNKCWRGCGEKKKNLSYTVGGNAT